MQTTINGSGVGRRSFLKGIGAGAVATTVFAGTAAARRPQFPENNPNRPLFVGEGVDLVGGPNDDIWTVAATDRRGTPTMLGIWMTEAAFESVTSGVPAHFHLEFPEVEGLNFTFAGVDWNPMGHPPENVWTVPHFDFHFYLMEKSAVEDIPFGIPTFTIPAEQLPAGYVTEDVLGAPSRTVIPAMGEHLVDPGNPAPPYALIYGAYDPAIDRANPGELQGYVDFATRAFYPPTATDVPASATPLFLLTSGDGVGELTFVEPMITADFMASLTRGKGELRLPISTPERFPVAGYYPTEYAVRHYRGKKAFLVSLESFEWVDGATA